MNQKHLQQFLTLMALLFISASCLAVELSPLNNGLKTITDSLLGGTGITIATIAVCGVGIGCLFGAWDWKWLMIIVGSIAMLFSAPTLVDIIKKAAVV